MVNTWSRIFSPSFLLAGLVVLGYVVCAATASSSQPSPSPSADVELICHTDNSSECYPKIFQPTDEFQIVREDQDLPPGLHVRLNIATGLKEAKINVPGEENPALEGLPVDSSVVLVDQEESAVEIPIPSNAPAYDPAGKIKKPQDESGDFYKSLSILKKGLNVDEALEMLEEISHDIYYGLKISEDFDTVRKLFCLANTGDIYADGQDTSVVTSRARLAALTIASTTQNNPKALAEIEKHWPALQKEICPNAQKNSPSEKLSTSAFRLVGGKPGDRNDPALAKVRVSAISGLIRSPVIRKDFLDNGGMELLLEVLVRSDEPEWEPARRKVGFLVLDNFLDENMGATLGEWPTHRQLPDSLCEKTTEAVNGGCWDWWAKKLADEHKRDKSHWTQELWTNLKEQRKANGDKPRAKKEL